MRARKGAFIRFQHGSYPADIDGATTDQRTTVQQGAAPFGPFDCRTPCSFCVLAARAFTLSPPIPCWPRSESGWKSDSTAPCNGNERSCDAALHRIGVRWLGRTHRSRHWVIRVPALLSRSLILPLSKPRSSHCSSRISLRRRPVSTGDPWMGQVSVGLTLFRQVRDPSTPVNDG